MKGLYLMFEGLPPTVIDAVTLRHIAAMGSAYGVAFSLVTVACTSDIWRRSRERVAKAREIAKCEITLLRGWRPSMPGSVRMNAQILAGLLGQTLPSFDFIHARTDYSTAVAGALRRGDRPRIIWDCRGHGEAEIVDALQPSTPPLHRLLASVRCAAAERHRRAAARAADGAIFVSEALRRCRGADLAPTVDALVAPNCADEDVFFLSPELRGRARAKLGVTPRETLFVYSGGVSAYQRIEDTMRWFAALAGRNPGCRLLLLTPEPGVVSAMADRLKVPGAPIIRCVEHNEVNAYLNAADAAFMFRHRDATNHVASPTKFAEYCMTGLPVVMSDAVAGAFANAQHFGNYVAEDELDPLRCIAEIDRASVAALACAALGRRSQLRAIFDLYCRVASPAAAA